MNSQPVRIASRRNGRRLCPWLKLSLVPFSAKEELDVDVPLVGDPEQIKASSQPVSTSCRQLSLCPPKARSKCTKSRSARCAVSPRLRLMWRWIWLSERADGVVSAGHSGAAMAAALLRLGRIKGIDRPAIGAVFPTVIASKSVLILDVGANVDCRPKYLEQFAVMGSIYSRYVLGIENPRVGLINIGEEKSKGNEVAVQVYKTLRADPQVD